MKNFKFFIIIFCCLCLVAGSFFVGFQLPNWASSQVVQPTPEDPGETPDTPTPEEPGETPDNPVPEEPEQTNKVLKLVWDEIEFVDEGFPFGGEDVWTDGVNLYYLDDYKLNKDTLTWEKMYWGDFILRRADCVWTDGKNIYYSYETTQYKLNKETSTWEEQKWNGLSDFDGFDVWTDGENYYYSGNAGRDQYKLNKETSTWEEMHWQSPVVRWGRFVWTDGVNIYCSDITINDLPGYPECLRQAVLNKETLIWEDKSWNGLRLSSLDGRDVWTDGENVYYSYGTTHYKLHKETSTWEEVVMTGIEYFYPHCIFSDGEDYYYSSGDNQFKLDKETLVWEKVAFTIPFSFIGQQVWADGEKTFVNSYVFNKNLGNWEKFSWNGDFHAVVGPYVWTDGKNIYYSNGTTQYKLNKETSTWEEQKWNGLTYFLGWDIWTDGQEIYYSKDDLHYKLNKETSTWEEKTWNGITAFEGKDVWYFEDEVYLYRCKLDIDSSTWERFLATSVAGQYIWTDGKNFYYSPGERFNSTYAFSPVDKTFYKVELEGLSISYFSAYNIWTDGENVYYSYGNDHYILSSVVYENSNSFVNSNEVA